MFRITMFFLVLLFVSCKSDDDNYATSKAVVCYECVLEDAIENFCSDNPIQNEIIVGEFIDLGYSCDIILNKEDVDLD